ncbi:hypothetical protein ACQEVF_44950 [Nonomuraea polychroma]|uniref:hypothetical protein n=1 Tax=Nonomuraea polychroma TaxID=46176 RepID=UPI003D934FD3
MVVWWLLSWQAAIVTAADLLHHSSTTACRKGATGERATARRLQSLERAGYTVLHDRTVPRSPTNMADPLVRIASHGPNEHRRRRSR